MTQKKTRVNRSHKDRLFLRVFGDKTALLELYNALNHTDYTEASDMEITTIENVVFMTMKNDISFIFNHELNLYEHQSTFTGNLPLRGLLYLADVFQGYIEQRGWNVFSSKRIVLPCPKYVIFYNGKEDMPDRQELKLSDSFLGAVTGETYLEFKAEVLNINFGKNKELMERSRTLYEYSSLIHYIRRGQRDGYLLEDAVRLAVDRCIEEHILEGFLRKHRGEVYSLLLTEYDEQKFLESEREVWKGEGKEEGMILAVIRLHAKAFSEKDISDMLELDPKYVAGVLANLNG